MYNRNFQAWVSDVLGHSSISTSFYYSTVGVEPGIKVKKEDIELKVFLIKDFRNYNSKVDQFEVFSVPRSTATAGIFFLNL